MAGTAKTKTTNTTKKSVGAAATRAAPRTRSKAPMVNREHMIAEAAYYRAEKRGFAAGDSMRDWLDAEVEIDQSMVKKPRKAAAKQ